MASDDMHSLFLAAGNGGHQPELMLCTVLHLMSHYTAGSESGPCLKLAAVIERHLKALAGRPDLAPVLQATCQQLSEQWAGIVERAMPRPQQKDSFLSRIMTRRSTPAATGPADA